MKNIIEYFKSLFTNREQKEMAELAYNQQEESVKAELPHKEAEGKTKAELVIGETVKIGTQLWCIRNLEVSIYRNGDTIPQVQDAVAWRECTTGAWCYYKNETANGTIYGKLYNWYAVNDPRGLAPERFHIPSDSEWTILIQYLGGAAAAGKKIKSISGWYDDGNGTNETGFAGLPGGSRYENGSFNDDIGKFGCWWSSTSVEATFNAWYRYVHWGWRPPSVNQTTADTRGFNRNYQRKMAGLSVRCIGD